MLRRAPLWALLALMLAMLPATASAQSAADVATARELFVEGAQLAREGKWLQARERYERSLALKRAPMTLYSLGVAQMSSGALVEALESFRAFLLEPPSPKSGKYREPATSAIEELEARVARVTVIVEPAGLAGLAVAIDGVAVPSAALDRPRLVDPGQHVVTASADAHRDAQAPVDLPEGGSERVVLRLIPLPAEPMDPRMSAPHTPDEADAGGFPILPVALMGGGGVLIAVAVGVGLAGWAQAKDAPTSDGDDATSARTKGIVADVLGGVGIVAAAIGVVLLVVDGGDEQPTAGTAQLWADDSSAGIRVWF